MHLLQPFRNLPLHSVNLQRSWFFTSRTFESCFFFLFHLFRWQQKGHFGCVVLNFLLGSFDSDFLFNRCLLRNQFLWLRRGLFFFVLLLWRNLVFWLSGCISRLPCCIRGRSALIFHLRLLAFNPCLQVFNLVFEPVEDLLAEVEVL